MSKSLGNFITIKDFLKRHSHRVLRLLFLKTHYRSPIDYSEKLIHQTERELERIDEFIDTVKSEIRNPKSEKIPKSQIQKFKKSFQIALEDDFNTPKAIAVLFTLIRKEKNSREALDFLKDIDAIFGFIISGEKKEKVPDAIKKLVALREQYRKQKLWNKADELRQQIEQKTWLVEDTSMGPKLKKTG